jgi:hypothetical protein
MFPSVQCTHIEKSWQGIKSKWFVIKWSDPAIAVGGGNMKDGGGFHVWL